MSAPTVLGSARPFAAVPSRRASMGRRAWLGVMLFLSALVAAYALALVLAPSWRPPLMQERFDRTPLATSLHLVLGALVIVLGPLQLSEALRVRSRTWHRWSGRAYALGVFASGGAGFALAWASQGGVPAHLGFALLALAWVGSTAMGVARIRGGDTVSHRRWMVRSVALTFAAVTLRLYIPLSVVLGLPFEPSYQAIAWLCWVPNLMVAEWACRRRGM